MDYDRYLPGDNAKILRGIRRYNLVASNFSKLINIIDCTSYEL